MAGIIGDTVRQASILVSILVGRQYIIISIITGDQQQHHQQADHHQ
jgi:hypothetical protein